VGGIIFDDEGEDLFRPARNKGSLLYFLENIVLYNRRLPGRKTILPNIRRLNDALAHTASVITHDHVVTVISDLSAIDDGTKHQLLNISAHNDVILVHIYDAFEEQLPDGRLVLSDGKKQITWRNKGTAWRDSFRETHRRLREEFQYTRMPVVFFNTTQPVEYQVMHHMSSTQDDE
jgi:hypothetical protein